MAIVGLAEAAKLTGRSQSTIHRAMKKGHLSYTVGEHGDRRIDTAELDRAFAIKAHDKANGAGGGGSDMPDDMPQPRQRQVTQAAEIAALREQLADRGATIDDLRARLDASEAERRASDAERRAMSAQLAALLAPPARKWWWRRG